MSDAEYNQGFSFSLKSPWNTAFNQTEPKDFAKSSQSSQHYSQANILNSFHNGIEFKNTYQEFGVRCEINLKSMIRQNQLMNSENSLDQTFGKMSSSDENCEPISHRSSNRPNKRK